MEEGRKDAPTAEARARAAAEGQEGVARPIAVEAFRLEGVRVIPVPCCADHSGPPFAGERDESVRL